MNDEERAARIEALLLKFSQAMTRKAALEAEAIAFQSRLREVRAAFGNPYFYSGQTSHTSESAARYTGYRAHDPGLRIVRRFTAIERELSALTEELRALGVTSFRVQV